MPDLYNMQLKIPVWFKNPRSYTIWLFRPNDCSQRSPSGSAGYTMRSFGGQDVRLLVQVIKEKKNTAVPCLRRRGVRLKA